MAITTKIDSGMKFISDVRGMQIVVDQPVESGGTNEGPTPPELLVVSLTTCVGVYAVMYMQRAGLDTAGIKITADYNKVTQPTRIGSITVKLEAPSISDEHKDKFMKFVNNCMVHNTLHHCPEISIDLE